MEKPIKTRAFPFAKFQVFLSVRMGVLGGIYYSFGGLLLDGLASLGWNTSSKTPGLGYDTLLAFGALIGMPLIATTAGFVAGLFEDVLYNLFGKWFGGIKINFLQYG